ncbi:IclR family transcriptional regulator [Caldibacillus thermolactis]|jgi:IclR family transcriptional regulator, KDG regulon repressor|uniref:IclR family transcriptional regulator n=1 Tax=Pallidibacillus thermolactis TaxID=251051 RepID=A0ABT2WFN9_9BACI|nr:IclR family transcriptional regulator [Pallidibacillus thermolactis]MCU9594498.1 IclR family transcriptional regulator [Pallidibacillus thermolactis]MCU9600969.1 IclR family transcriptional regulator [Pallidibacillus thermolactis subsp. kokeshiiformis]
MTHIQKNKETLSSVINAMRILRLFSFKQKELSFTQIVHLLDLPQSTVHRLISTLKEEGFLSKNPKTNHYRLGLRILSLGGAIYSHLELYKESLPIIKSLSKKLNETAHICHMENNKVVYLYRTETLHPEDRLVTQIGRTSPIHCTSEGLCILAFQEETFIKQYLNQKFFAFTPYTFTKPDQLYQLLEQIRDQDYCVLTSSYFENYISISSPIRNHEKHVIASLTVIGSVKRITEEKLPTFINEIKHSASKISSNLGYFKNL